MNHIPHVAVEYMSYYISGKLNGYYGICGNYYSHVIFSNFGMGFIFVF